GGCPGARRRGKQVADERVGGRRAGGFADADAEPHGEQLPVVAGEARRRRQEAPDEEAGAEDALTGELIAQAAEGHADGGVEQGERGAQRADRRVAQPPLPADRLADRAEDRAIEEVDQIDGEEHRERVVGTVGHGGVQNGCRPPRIPASAIRRRAGIASTPVCVASWCTNSRSRAPAPRAASAAAICLPECARRSAASLAYTFAMSIAIRPRSVSWA